MTNAAQPAARLIWLAAPLVALAGCSDPLQDQESLMPHEQPLLSVPAGVVPMKLDPHAHRSVEPAQSFEDARELANPFEAHGENITRGKLAFDRYCSHCHGDLGRGWTSVGSSLDPAPPDLVRATDALSDGDIFGIVTFGRRLSPALGPTISVDDRWQIVLFLRTLRARRERVEPDWGQ